MHQKSWMIWNIRVFRFTMNAEIGKLIIPIKVDISTGDVITPGAIEYQYKMLLSNEFISIIWKLFYKKRFKQY